MKILITTDWYTPSVNGVVTCVLNLQKQLETAGHKVRVLTLAQTGNRTAGSSIPKERAVSGICLLWEQEKSIPEPESPLESADSI